MAGCDEALGQQSREVCLAALPRSRASGSARMPDFTNSREYCSTDTSRQSSYSDGVIDSSRTVTMRSTVVSHGPPRVCHVNNPDALSTRQILYVHKPSALFTWQTLLSPTQESVGAESRRDVGSVLVTPRPFG